MTIYTSRIVEKKDDSDIPDPEVVTEPGKEPLLLDALTGVKKDIEVGAVVPPTRVTLSPNRRSNCSNICIMVTAFIVLATGILGGIYLYKHLAHRTFHGYCQARYYEYQKKPFGDGQGLSSLQRSQRRIRHYGQFEEEIELDRADGKYEKIMVPEFENCKRATVLHDFVKNMTVIVDKDHSRCFLMPLNRTIITPAKDFWDMLGKMSSGYYLPDVELIREKYRVLQPAIYDLSPYGYYIWSECHYFNSYKLVRVADNEPIAMVKRDTYSVENNLVDGVYSVSLGVNAKYLPVIEIVE